MDEKHKRDSGNKKNNEKEEWILKNKQRYLKDKLQKRNKSELWEDTNLYVE